MSEHEKDSVLSCLFSGQGMKLRNVRFARGNAERIDEADFREEICRAAAQRADGTARLIGWPKTKRAKVDVSEFLAA